MNIYEKLSNIQQELKAPKNQYNSIGGYSYRSCEDILEAVKPLLKEYKCVLQLEDYLENIGNRYYVRAIAKLIDAEKPYIEDDEITLELDSRSEEYDMVKKELDKLGKKIEDLGFYEMIINTATTL